MCSSDLIELSNGDLHNIALMHTFLAVKPREQEELRHAYATVQAYEKHTPAPAPDLYEALGTALTRFDGKKAAELLLTAAAQFDATDQQEAAGKAFESALKANPLLASTPRILGIYGGSTHFLALLPDRSTPPSTQVSLRIDSKDIRPKEIEATINPAGAKGLYRVTFAEKAASGTIVLQIARGNGAGYSLSESVSAPTPAATKVEINEPLAGDRFLSGEAPPNTQRVTVRVYADARAMQEKDKYVQSATGIIDPASSLFFAPMQSQLRSQQQVTVESVSMEGKRAPDASRPVEDPSILQDYTLFLDIGERIATGPATVRSRPTFALQLEIPLISWVPDSAWPFRGAVGQLKQKRLRDPHWSLRWFEDGGVSSTTYSSSPAARGISINTQQRVDFGFYAPLLSNNFTMAFHDRYYSLFVAPLAAGRLTADANHINAYPELGGRIGILRAPLTLRAIQPQPFVKVDVLWGKGDSYRGFLHVANSLQAQNELQIKGETRLFMTPLVAGFTKTVGPWPRDLSAYLSFRFDLISLYKVFRGPTQRTF